MTDLVERRADLHALERIVDGARAGRGGFAVVEGPAGIGKSVLVAGVAADAGQAGVLVLRATCRPLERELSFGVAQQLFERHLADAEPDRRARLLSGAAGLSAPAVARGWGPASAPADAPFAIAHGIHWLVANLAQERPVLLVVDDLQWADAPSLRALSHVAVRLDGLSAAMVGAVRGGESAQPDEVGELVDVATTVVRPEPLSHGGVAAALERHCGGPAPAPLAAAVHSATGGNPLLVRELARALAADAVDLAQVEPSRVARIGPPAVARALLLRLGRMPGPAVTVARAVAVLAGRADVQHVAALAGVEAEAVVDTADALAAAEVLTGARPLDFVHPVVRAAVDRDMPPGVRARLHAAAAVALREAGVSAAELAPHLLASDPAGDAGVVTALRSAARRAMGHGAPGLAVRYLARALREPPPAPDLATVLGELGAAEWMDGVDMDAAVEHLSAALRLVDEPADRAEPALALHRALFAAGRILDSVRLLQRELAVMRGVADPEAVMRVEAEAGAVALLHPSTAAVADRRLPAFGSLAGDTPAQLLQLANVACHHWAVGTAADTVREGIRSLARARDQAADICDSVPIYEALWALAYTDTHDVALAVLDQTLSDARARGSVFGVTTSCALRSLIALRRGDTGLAEMEARSGTGLPGLSDFVRPPLFGALAQALIERGDLAGAEEALEHSGCGPGLPEFVCLNPVFHVRGCLRLAQGRLDEALADFEECGRRAARVRLRNPGDPWRLGAARTLMRLGRGDEAVALVDEQLDLARHWGTASAVGAALRARAVVAGGDVEALARAAATLAGSPDRLEYGRCLVDLGAALRGANRRVDARVPLREALDIAERGGASPLAARAHEELVVAGARPRRRVLRGVDALTAAERRAAEMAASGRTNREIAQELFVTAKTVENQLGRAYAKLGVRSRADLPSALAPAPAGSPAPTALNPELGVHSVSGSVRSADPAWRDSSAGRAHD